MLRSYSKGIVNPKLVHVSREWVNLGGLMHSRGNKQIYKWGTPIVQISYTENQGLTRNTVDWSATYYDIANISAIRITEAGNIVVFSKTTDARVSTDKGISYNPCTILGLNGEPYVFHTPVEQSFPGGYFEDFNNFCENNGVCVYGNYANVSNGASPVNMYYSIDGGITWKVFYTFGQNDKYRDDGTANGGDGIGTLLGNPDNPIRARHIHGINLGSDGSFYACTGDVNPVTPELHFMKMTYNSGSDTWTVVDLLNDESVTCERMRAIGVFEHKGYIYWGVDGLSMSFWNGTWLQSTGIWRSKIVDLNDLTKHELLLNTDYIFYSFINSGKYVLAGYPDTVGYQDKYFLSSNYGKNWKQFTKDDVFSVWHTYADSIKKMFVYSWAKIIDWSF